MTTSTVLDASPAAISGSQRARWTLVSLSLAMLLSSLGTSIANVALPALAQAFGASFQQVQWVVLVYLLTTTTVIVSAGRLGDLIGSRRLLVTGIFLFTVASLICGLVPTLPLLIAARVAQGLGAAVMMALAIALVGETVPKEKTGSAMGLLGTDDLRRCRGTDRRRIVHRVQKPRHGGGEELVMQRVTPRRQPAAARFGRPARPPEHSMDRTHEQPQGDRRHREGDPIGPAPPGRPRGAWGAHTRHRSPLSLLPDLGMLGVGFDRGFGIRQPGRKVCGEILMDTGVDAMYLSYAQASLPAFTPAIPKKGEDLWCCCGGPCGFRGPQRAQVTVSWPDIRDPKFTYRAQAPEEFDWRQQNPTTAFIHGATLPDSGENVFVNTSRQLLVQADYLYDATCGYVGFRNKAPQGGAR